MFKYIYFLGVILCFYGCAKKHIRSIQTPLTGVNGPLVIARIPKKSQENTLNAIKNSISQGADWQEVSVYLQKDHIIISHDPDHINKKNLPLLYDVLKTQKTRFMIDMRLFKNESIDRFSRYLVKSIDRSNSIERILVGSSHQEILWKIYYIAPHIPLIAICETKECIQNMIEIPIVAIALPIEILDKVFSLLPNSLAIWTWNANTFKKAEKMVLSGVHGIITDTPLSILKEVRKPAQLYLR